MSEQLAASLFDESTSMYSQGNYPVCLALLNDCILLEPNLSILYSNRAISNFSLKQVESALFDLTKSIEINHLNYVAYFNLFSLNFLESKSDEAFKNLCFSLSSIYTALARHSRNIDWINQSIFYSWNNKQSIFLKAMEQLQNNKHQEAVNLLKVVVSLQIVEENRNGVHQILNFVEKSSGVEVTAYSSALKSFVSPFKLMTNVPCPGQNEFDEQVQKMLKEFNGLNKLIHEYQDQNIREMNPSTQKSIENSEKMEKQTNCKTIYESNLQRSDECLKQQKNLEDQCTFSRESRVDKLHLYSSISEIANDEDEQIRTKVSSYDIYPLNGEQKIVRIYFEQTLLYNAAETKDKFKNLYGVFHYKSDESQSIIRTPHTNIKQGLCRWAEWSEDIRLSHNPSNINFTIFSKTFTSFEDPIIGKGSFILDSLGFTTMEITNSVHQQIGRIQAIIERAN